MWLKEAYFSNIGIVITLFLLIHERDIVPIPHFKFNIFRKILLLLWLYRKATRGEIQPLDVYLSRIWKDLEFGKI